MNNIIDVLFNDYDENCMKYTSIKEDQDYKNCYDSFYSTLKKIKSNNFSDQDELINAIEELEDTVHFLTKITSFHAFEYALNSGILLGIKIGSNTHPPKKQQD